MSVREYPSEDSRTRQERAEATTIEDVRIIEGQSFGEDVTVYEVDLTNEDGERRENVTIVPSILFESTKDVQHRHEFGIVGKYTRALAMANSEAMTEVLNAIDQKRTETQGEIRRLQDKDARLLHTKGDLKGL